MYIDNHKRISDMYYDSKRLISLCSALQELVNNVLKIVSEYDQEIPQSQTADNPMAPTYKYLMYTMTIGDWSKCLTVLKKLVNSVLKTASEYLMYTMTVGNLARNYNASLKLSKT